MSDRTLKTVQIASLLLSTTCGTGFLLGIGELALHKGMAGCLYAVASALGLVALAACARRLSTTGQSIWTRLHRIYGVAVGRAVALLSLVWMTGVLAAQIRGETTILNLMGIGQTFAMMLVDGLLLCLSLLRLSWLAAGFAICLLACNFVLVFTLLLTDGLGVWLHAPIQLLDGLQRTTLNRTGFTIASVALMVICGADYQQFLLAARKPTMARNGCLFAAGLVLVIGFLPASAVISASPVWHLQHLADPVQVIPVVLMHTIQGNSPNVARMLVVFILLMTALGAGYSILRAMTDAISTLSPHSVTRSIWSRVVPIAAGTIIATRNQGLVEMMIDLNTIYITAVGPLLGLALLNRRVSDRCANATLTVGGIVATAIYFAKWAALTMIPDTDRLTVACLPMLLIAALLWSRSTAVSTTE